MGKSKSNVNENLILAAQEYGIPTSLRPIAMNCPTYSKMKLYFSKIKEAAEKDIPQYLQDILKCDDHEARKLAICSLINPTYLDKEFMNSTCNVRELARFLLSHGQTDKRCNIILGKTYLVNSTIHVRNMRALNNKVPIRVAMAFDGVKTGVRVTSYLEAIKAKMQQPEFPNFLLINEENGNKPETLRKFLEELSLPSSFWENLYSSAANTTEMAHFLFNQRANVIRRDTETCKLYERELLIEMLAKRYNISKALVQVLVHNCENVNSMKIAVIKFLSYAHENLLPQYIEDVLVTNDMGAKAIAIETYLSPIIMAQSQYMQDDYYISYITLDLLELKHPNGNHHLVSNRVYSNRDALHITNMRILTNCIPARINAMFGFVTDDAELTKIIDTIKESARIAGTSSLISSKIKHVRKNLYQCLSLYKLPKEIKTKLDEDQTLIFDLAEFMYHYTKEFKEY